MVPSAETNFITVVSNVKSNIYMYIYDICFTTDSANVSACDPCPVECQIENYNFRLSYSVISSSSADTIIVNHAEKMNSDLQNAANIRARVEETPMFTTMKYIKNAFSALKDAQRIMSVDILDTGNSIFSQVQQGMEAIVGAATSDIKEVMFGKFPSQMDSYQKYIAPEIQFITSSFDDIDRSLKYLHQILLWDDVKNTTFNYDIERVQQSLTRYLSYFDHRAMTEVQNPLKLNISLYPDVGEYLLPINFVKGKDAEQMCLVNIYNVYDISPIIVDILDTMDMMPNQNIREQLRMFIELVMALSDIVRECYAEYGNYLQLVENWMNDSPTTNKASTITVNLIPGELFRDVTSHVKWMHRMYDLYTNNSITKFDLLAEFEAEHMQSAASSVDNLRMQIQQVMSNPMKNKLQEMKSTLTLYYITGLKHLIALASYYDVHSRAISDRAQNIGLWKKPHANLNDPEILSYRLEGERFYGSIYADGMLNTEMEQDVADNLAHFMDGLVQAIDDFDQSMVDITERLQTVFSEIDMIMDEFRESSRGQFFLRYVCIHRSSFKTASLIF